MLSVIDKYLYQILVSQYLQMRFLRELRRLRDEMCPGKAGIDRAAVRVNPAIPPANQNVNPESLR